jgi:signal transduction histidine kinase
VKRGDQKESRQVTDTKLRLERDRADDELAERSAALGENADDVIRRARERAGFVLALARDREDRALDATGAGTHLRAEIGEERTVADEVVQQEYAEADAALFDERSQHRRAIMQLLALERDETDRMLSSERRVSDHMVAVRDDVLGVVSHDLRSHLNAMLVRTSVVLMTHSQDVVLANHMQALQRSLGQMDLLLNDLLDVASMEMGRLRVERAPTDLAVVVADEVGVHRPAAEARSIQLDLEVHESPLVVEIDPARMSRVLMNLLTNALKFTPEGGRIEVTVERRADDAYISIKDSGPGIAADQLETVFERFSRSDPRTRGYGLGLYIARTIIDAHGGRIWVESKLGEGATFHVRLPVPKGY